jgi:hypothetical protein
MSLFAGAAVADITPRAGLDLSGGAFGTAKSVLHPLSARALFLDDGATTLLLISCDLLGFDWDYALSVRRAIRETCGLPVDAIMLTATHTHAGPATVRLRNWGEIDKPYCDDLRTKLVTLADAAAAGAAPAAVGAAAGMCHGVAVNRTSYGNGLTNDALGVIRVDHADGQPAAVVVNYACHPVNLHKGGVISPDFPYHVERAIQEQYADTPVLYLTGACGDLNPATFDPEAIGDSVPPVDILDGNAATTGQQIAGAALGLLSGISTDPDARLACAAADVDIPLLPLPSREELLQLLEERREKMAREDPSPTNWAYTRHKANVEWAEEALDVLEQDRQETHWALTFEAFVIGDAVLLGIPGELFTEPGLAIIEKSPFAQTMVVTLANGCFGYIPTRTAYERQSYEAIHCPRHLGLYAFDPGVAELAVGASVDLLNRLKKTGQQAE